MPVIVVSGPIINELQGQGATSVASSDQMIVTQVISSFLPEWLVEPISGLFSQLILILWYSGIQIIMFLAILQKIDLNMIEAAKIDGATGWEIFWKITLPAIRSIILLNAVYTLVYLANSGTNGVINLISAAMLKATRGYGYASSMAWMHSLIVLVLLGLIFLMLKGKADAFLKKQKKIAKENKRRERQRRRWEADAKKRADA